LICMTVRCLLLHLLFLLCVVMGCVVSSSVHGVASFLVYLTVPQLNNKFPALMETEFTNSLYITACHLSLSLARSIQSTPSRHISSFFCGAATQRGSWPPHS
jgi:hypothetical protein